MNDPASRPNDIVRQVPASVPLGVPEFLARQAGVSCADCGQTLGFADLAGIKVAACPGCHGVLIQREFVWPIVQRLRQAGQDTGEMPDPLNPDALRRQTDCPVCGLTMETFPYAGPGCVVIDACRQCDVMWLNGGELTQIARAPGKRDGNGPGSH